ncbi:AraC family transcriptional regulator [Streptomyces chrestomyceticus JCM 4735]|uniref:AraC family transcriptional regulator n=1 Tax=Streptomyces chrestomyceticus JCM 4735 TaxID=1306181 RepID=A0A7U9KWI3_9ACTN|nr:helix-turn-helix domain-containing protein [Streptomyces chrestomyceticus]GCD36106.1 AraC family transcriptional regulator [Streptomyces chrestomyceticus JCM 4735]
MTVAAPHRVTVLALAPVVAFDLSIPAQMLAMVTPRPGRAAYEVRAVTPDGSAVATVNGYGVLPQGDLSLLEHADTVIVAGTRCPDVLDGGVVDPRVTDALRAATRRRARMVSLCTGSFVLAAAGLLEGRRAATHWRYADQFRRLFPSVGLDTDPLYVADRGMLTSAGGAAAIDLCLHLIREDHGSSVANQVARYNVVAPMRDGGQAQYIDHPVAEDAGTSTAAARALMSEHLDRRLSLKELAAHCHMSVRSFTRRFRQETGTSPAEWLTSARLKHARHLLESTELPVDDIAARTGLGSGTNLRQHMRVTLDTTPSAYRRAFRSTAASRTDARA